MEPPLASSQRTRWRCPPDSGGQCDFVGSHRHVPRSVNIGTITTMTTNTNTVRLHRVLRATPERVYRAFLDADAMAKWLPPNGFTGKVHQIDAKVGGTYKMS